MVVVRGGDGGALVRVAAVAVAAVVAPLPLMIALPPPIKVFLRPVKDEKGRTDVVSYFCV